MPRNRFLPNWTTVFLVFALVFVACMAFYAVTAFAAPDVANEVQDVPPTNRTLAFSSIQFWTFVIGSVTPLVGYLINTYAKWISEPVKAFVQIALAAAASCALQLLDAGELALNAQTLQLVGTAIAAALFTHKFLWLPAGIGQILGAGQNRNLAIGR